MLNSLIIYILFALVCCYVGNRIIDILHEIRNNGEVIKMKLSELSAMVVAISDQIAKAKIEVLAKITALEVALADVELPAEAQVALDGLKAKAQELDDIVPDA